MNLRPHISLSNFRLFRNFFFFEVLSTIFVSVSIVGMTISTLPSLQYKDAKGNTIDNPYLAMVETYCIAWFTLEYFIRLAGAPQKWAFLKDGMNVVDVLAIMPFFVSLFFGSGSEFGSDSSEESSESIPSSGELDDTQKGGMDEILQVVSYLSVNIRKDDSDEGSAIHKLNLQVFRIFKLARVLKLARHSPGLQVIRFKFNLWSLSLCRQLFTPCAPATRSLASSSSSSASVDSSLPGMSSF